MERLVIVGPGRLGLALGTALVQAEAVRSLTYFGRAPEPPAHPLFERGLADYHFGLARPDASTTAVVLAVPDDVLGEMAWALAALGPPESHIPALTASISISSDAMAPLHSAGYAVGTWHPMVTLAGTLDDGPTLHGAPVVVSGEVAAAAAGRRMVQALGGSVLEVPVTRRPLAAGARAVVLEAARAIHALGTDLFADAGLSEDDAALAVSALMRSAGKAGPGTAGPRHDAEEIDLHLRALPPRARDLYRHILEGLEEPAASGPDHR